MVEEEDENSIAEIRIDVEEEVWEKTEKDMTKQFGLRTCYVKLHNFISSIGSNIYKTFIYCIHILEPECTIMNAYVFLNFRKRITEG